MRKFIGFGFLVLLTVAFALTVKNQPTRGPLQTNSYPEQIKAVHYFASSWPKTFWGDFEKSEVEDDLLQIKADGFNTVILVIPWMGFETGFDTGTPQPSPLYERLEWLLEKIDQSGLDFGLRVSFPHNFDPENGIVNWEICRRIFVDKELRKAWVRYIERIAQRVSNYRNSFKFAFFSWEDFFCPYATFPNKPEEERLDLARKSGYQEWLEENYSGSMLGFMYQQPFDSWQEVPFPERKSPAFFLYMKFIDQFMVNELLMPAREKLPELAMEVRVDKDPVYIGEKIHWAEHDLGLTDSQLRGSYWGAFHGARNEGEILTANEALQNFEYMLNEISDNGRNINHIVEQFNFVDNTPGFDTHHARIAEQELPAFLEGSAHLLKEKSRGYGLWTYRDYTDSALYNGSFEMGLKGWQAAGEASLVSNTAGDRALLMQAGAMISQAFSPHGRFVALGLSEQLHFCANFGRPPMPAEVTLTINQTTVGQFSITDSERKCVALNIETIKQSHVEVSITTNAELEIDDLQLFAFVQRLHVYDENGEPGPLRDLIVRFNKEWLAK